MGRSCVPRVPHSAPSELGGIIGVVSDDATFWIALWGAVTGSIATGGGIIALLRDRPQIAAHQEIDSRKAGDDSYAKMVLHVVNNGRQPATVFQAGFATRTRKEGRWPRRDQVVSMLTEVDGPELPKRLAPGELVTLTFDLIRPNYAFVTDDPPQGFAWDTRGKLTEAKPRITKEYLDQVYDNLWPSRQGGDLPGGKSRGENPPTA